MHPPNHTLICSFNRPLLHASIYTQFLLSVHSILSLSLSLIVYLKPYGIAHDKRYHPFVQMLLYTKCMISKPRDAAHLRGCFRGATEGSVRVQGSRIWRELATPYNLGVVIVALQLIPLVLSRCQMGADKAYPRVIHAQPSSHSTCMQQRLQGNIPRIPKQQRDLIANAQASDQYKMLISKLSCRAPPQAMTVKLTSP